MNTLTDTVVTEVSSDAIINQTSYNAWNALDFCNGIHCKRIMTPDSYKGFLLRYDKGMKTPKHYNSEEYEILQVRDGIIVDLMTNEVYSKGDIIVYDKGQEHEIKCIDEAYVFCIMTDKQEVVKKIVA
jgi:quercetin dioxygenase-like cupin family protein